MPEPTLIAGRRLVVEALRAGRVRELWLAEGGRGLQPVVEAARAAGLRPVFVARADLDRRARDHQGVLASVGKRATVDLHSLLRGADLLVAAAGILDPRNLGALARSAEAVGAQGLLLPARRAAGVTLVAERAAAGALEHLPVAIVTNLVRALEACKDAGLWICGADPDATQTLWDVDLSVPLVIAVGGEGRGLPRLVRESCDLRVRLPMRGRVASLNAAVAAGVLLYEVVRQRSRTMTDAGTGPAPAGRSGPR